ncbi:HDIG domain-containing metalloprotein [Desulfovibrio sp. TomC]|uniref:HDIG domain-containing metalloprotein n=1 Tax=Desulfovibrio sp. TomC TaxID=1562888 RepID=UPI0005BB6C77
MPKRTQTHLAAPNAAQANDSPALGPIPAEMPRISTIPTDAQCRELWDAYGMLSNIRVHSELVACVATALAEMALQAGLAVNVAEVRAAALLHDLAKTYTISHGGNHCQLGAAWVQEATGNPALAQGVLCHVSWPHPIDLRADFLPLTLIYSDKRVKHNQIVPLESRFDDLLVRYGTTEYIRTRIRESFTQAEAIERALAETVGMDIHESTFGCGRLVE